MTSKQRMAAALAGHKVDRVPCGFSLHFRDEDHHGKRAVKAHLDFYRESGVDFLKVMNENRFCVSPPIQDIDDWKRVRPIRGDEPYVRDQLDIVKELADTVGHEVFLYTTIHGVFASAFHATGDPDTAFAHENRVSDHLKRSPETVEVALRNIAEGLALFARKCVEAGSDGIYYAALGAEKYRFSPEEFSRSIKPNDLLVLDAVRDARAGTILHICKDQLNLELYADYPADVVNWATHENNLDLAAGKTLFGRTVLGGFDDRAGVLVEETDADIDQEVRRLIESFGTRGFILGADCTLPTDIEYHRVRRAVEAARPTKYHDGRSARPVTEPGKCAAETVCPSVGNRSYAKKRRAYA